MQQAIWHIDQRSLIPQSGFRIELRRSSWKVILDQIVEDVQPQSADRLARSGEVCSNPQSIAVLPCQHRLYSTADSRHCESVLIYALHLLRASSHTVDSRLELHLVRLQMCHRL